MASTPGRPKTDNADRDTLVHMRAHADLGDNFRAAVRSERWSDAALLLQRSEGQRDLDTDVTTAILDEFPGDELHRVRQEYGRLRNPAFVDTKPQSRQARQFVQHMRSAGIVHAPRFIRRRRLRRIQAEIDCSIDLLGRTDFRQYDQRHYWREEQQALVFNDALAMSAELANFCRSPALVQTANHYLGKTAHIKRVYGMRYLPKEPPDSHQFGWHHDMEDRMFKVMVLLSDVSATDQYMSYVAGTQDTFHPYPCFLHNSLSFEQIGADPDTAHIVNTIGRAGDVFFFDPNGMHRGNRTLGAARDAVFIEFTTDGNLDNVWGSDLGISDPDRFGQSDDDPLHRFRDLTPKWERRRDTPRVVTTWAESLPLASSWVRQGAG